MIGSATRLYCVVITIVVFIFYLFNIFYSCFSYFFYIQWQNNVKFFLVFFKARFGKIFFAILWKTEKNLKFKHDNTLLADKCRSFVGHCIIPNYSYKSYHMSNMRQPMAKNISHVLYFAILIVNSHTLRVFGHES